MSSEWELILGRLILLILVVFAAYWPFSLKNKLDKYHLLFYAFSVLLFCVIYSVSFLNFKIAGTVSVEEVKQEKEKAISEIESKLNIAIQEIDHKISSVRKLSELLSTISSDNNNKLGLLGLSKSGDEFRNERTKIIQSFREVGSSDDKIKEIIAPLNEQIIKTYNEEVLEKIQHELYGLKNSGKITEEERVALDTRFIQKLIQAPKELLNVDASVDLLKVKNIYTKEIEKKLLYIKEFISKKDDLNYL